MVIIVFYDSSFKKFWIKLIFFEFLENFYVASVDLYEPVKLFQAWNRDTG